MRRLVTLLLLLVVFAAPALAETSHGETHDAVAALSNEVVFTNVDTGKSIKLGMTRAEVEAIVGGQIGDVKQLYPGALAIEQHGDIAGMAFRNDVLVQLQIDDDSWATNKGIKVGSSFSELAKAYALQEIKERLNYQIAFFNGFSEAQQGGLNDEARLDFDYSIDFRLSKDDYTIRSILLGDRDALMFLR